MKNGVETEILCLEDKSYTYFKTIKIIKDDSYDIINVEVEDTLFTDCLFYKILKKDTKKIVDFNASHEDIEEIKKSLSEVDMYLEEVSREEFIKYWEDKKLKK